MTCADILRIIARNAGDLPADVRVHLDQCADCRRLAEFLRGLDQAGSGERGREWSAERLRATRLAAAEILDRRRREPVAPAAWPWARAVAWALPALAAVALGVAVSLTPRTPPAVPPGEPVDAARLDAEIAALSGGLNCALSEFREEHRGLDRIPVDAEAQDLMVDMELFARRLVEELAVIGVPAADDAGPEK